MLKLSLFRKRMCEQDNKIKEMVQAKLYTYTTIHVPLYYMF